jgi:transcriptional regulator of heat shock response
VRAANYPEHRVRGDCRCSTCATPCRPGSRWTARSTTSCCAAALRLAQASLEDISRQQAFSVEGASALLENGPDGVSVATLRALLEMMDEKERMLHLLNQYIDGPGSTVVIGAEHTAPGLRPFSLIAGHLR